MLNPAESLNYNKNYASIDCIKELTNSQLEKVKKENLEELISIENLYVCHPTSYFPDRGIIYPRTTFTGNNATTSEDLKKIQDFARQIFCICRSTVHFGINLLFSEHIDYKITDHQRFIIIDKLENAQNALSGGYIEDLFCIGPYTLSDQATILIPSSSRDRVRDKIQKLSEKINCFYYEGEDKEAFNAWMNKKKINVLQPVEEDPNIPNFIGILGKHHYLSSQLLMQTIKKTLCTHDITPMVQIEYYIKDSFCNKPPYLNRLFSDKYEGVCQTLRSYIECIDQIYTLNQKQKDFIESYRKALFIAYNIFNSSKNMIQLEKIFNYYREAVVEYDKTFDLNYPVNCPAALQLSEVIQKPFHSFRRERCEKVIDAAWQSDLSLEETLVLVKKLESKCNLEFSFQEHQGHYYIVLKNLHLKNRIDKISKLFIEMGNL